MTSSIPLYAKHPAMNLAQAVMIYLYEIYQASLSANPLFYWDLAESSTINSFYERVQRVLNLIEFKPRKTKENFMLGLRRFLGRTPIEKRDIRLFHKIFGEIEGHIKKKTRSGR